VDMRHAFNLREGICELTWASAAAHHRHPPRDNRAAGRRDGGIDAQIYWVKAIGLGPVHHQAQ